MIALPPSRGRIPLRGFPELWVSFEYYVSVGGETWGTNLWAAVGERGCFKQVPVLRVVISDRGIECATLRGDYIAQPYNAACSSTRMYFHVFEKLGPLSQKSWGLRGSGGVGLVFGCLDFFGCLDISLGDWRKAVSLMMAPRGPVLGNR